MNLAANFYMYQSVGNMDWTVNVQYVDRIVKVLYTVWIRL